MSPMARQVKAGAQVPFTNAGQIESRIHDPVDSGEVPTDWLQLHMDTSADQAPILAILFENLGALSVTFGDAGDEPILEPAPGQTPLWHHTRITALFDGGRDADGLQDLLSRTLPGDLSGGLRFELLRDEPWERTWLKDFRPMAFGDRLRVVPGVQGSQADGAVTVCLEPGLAFGTGTHPTTAMCLRWLDHAEVAGKTLIDYGCGSGILAIAALQLGAASAMAVDRDPQALEATRNNAEKNGVLNRLSIHEGSSPPPEQADIVLANILSDTLIELCDPLSARVKAGGTIVLSGILEEQAGRVGSTFERSFEMRPPVVEQEWVLLEGQRKPA